MASNNITFPSYQHKSIRFDHWMTVLYDISWWIKNYSRLFFPAQIFGEVEPDHLALGNEALRAEVRVVNSTGMQTFYWFVDVVRGRAPRASLLISAHLSSLFR